jgi:leader peptidase (prepilin peptidase)/N-methyltransferase
MYDPFLVLIAIFVGLFGACIGSFLNVCIYRIPRDESIVHPRSHCPHCHTLIPWYLNLPVLSWLLLRGRCRFCRGPISPRYLLVELLTAILFLAILFQQSAFPRLLGMQQFDAWLLVPVYIVFTGGLILGTFVDFEFMEIPDSVTIGGTVAGLVFSALVPAMHLHTSFWHDPFWRQSLLSLLQAALAAALGAGVLWIVGWLGEKAFKKEAMGLGDVKLMGAVGAFLGWQGVLFTIVGGALAGSIVGILLILSRRTQLQGHIPFGPYLSLAALTWIYWGPVLWQAYAHLLTGMP